MRIKNLLTVLFVLLLAIQPAWAGISTTVIFEGRATHGSNTNGGGFVVGVLSKSSANYLVVSGTSNVLVSSSTYGFTSADVGRWLKVTSGTGWQTGYFQIKSVATGVATLGMSPAAISTTGGHFTVYYGLDYSQQNSKNTTGSNISTTDLVTAGTAIVTSATASFTQDIVGNVVYIAGGTGSITGGWYEVTGYTSATSVTVDRSTGLTTGTGATLNVGGALQTLAGIASAVNGLIQSTVYLKAEATYAVSGAVTLNNIIGYTSVRGDNGKATIQDTSTASITVLNGTGYQPTASNLLVDCNSNASTTGMASFQVAFNNKVTNCAVYSINGGGLAYNNETTGELSGCSGGINDTTVINNNVHDGQCAGVSGGILFGNTIVNRTGSSTDGIDESNYQNAIVIGNTVYNSGRYNLNTTYGANVVLNNIFVSSGSNQWYNNENNFGYVSQQSSTLIDGNAYYNSGALPNVVIGAEDIGWFYVNSHDVSLSGSPFVNASSGNFALNNTVGSGALVRNTGVQSIVPGLSTTSNYTSYGAVQPNNTTVAGGVCVSGQ